MAYANALDQQFIHDRVKVDDDGCWIWQRSLDRYGYPFLGPGAQERRAHRLAYRVFKGEIADGMAVDHICFITNCVNPDHLQLLTPSQNSKRKQERSPDAPRVIPTGTRRPVNRSHCSNGHEFTAENSRLVGNRIKCRTCDTESCRRRRAKASA